MPEIQAKSKVLEDNEHALFGDEVVAGEGEELVDLSEGSDAGAVPAKTAPAKAKPAPAAAAEDDLPPEYKGKSPKELVEMHRQAQSLIGRQGTELGEFRKKADMLIQASLANIQAQRAVQPAATAKVASEPIDDSAVFAKPVESIARLIAEHPAIKEIRDALGKTAANSEVESRTRAAERFNAVHPDAQATLRDPEFQAWVGKSRVRQALLQRAHAQYDFDAGDEVFSTWKELKGARSATTALPAAEAAESAAAVQTASDAGRALAAAKKAKALAAVAAPTGGGGQATTGKKIFRRADVLRLMETDPGRYEQMADEIGQAYKEGRVK